LAPRLELDIFPQPDDTTCGPTCLCAVYHYFDDDVPLARVIRETRELEGGGTLAVMLGCHALERGYRATMYTFNLTVFDPTWFENGAEVLSEKLRLQARVKRDPKLATATESYLEFLRRGGAIRFEDLTTALIRRFLKRSVPILTGLSATYLYRCARETSKPIMYDDILGEPAGHFVILSGYDKQARRAIVSDPLYDNPAFGRQEYEVEIDRLVGAILLGVLTYDANLLIIEPRADRRGEDT
jgi:hypothetical protein